MSIRRSGTTWTRSALACRPLTGPLLELALPELTQWAIDGRYPDDFVEATRDHAHRAVDLARQVIEAVERRLAAPPS